MAKRLIITCMKNEGPFILEWLAHHLAIGFDHVLVFTNDCDDGTVELLDALSSLGFVTRMDNPYLDMRGNMNPQKGALKYSERLDIVKNAEWVLVSDVDEYVNIHTEKGDLDSLFAAVPDAELIAMQWRLFGNNFRHSYDDILLTEKHTSCAPEFCPSPIQAWGIKSMFSTRGDYVAGSYDKIGVHRPLKRKTPNMPMWVNGSGHPLPDDYADQGWRFGTRDYGYDLVTLNHYAVRSTESFLVKRDRGRVNHINRDQGLSYWLRMNFNMEMDVSIQSRVPEIKKIIDMLLGMSNIKDLHEITVMQHRRKISELMSRPDMRSFYDEISSKRHETLSRHLNLLNRTQMSEGIDSVPEDLLRRLERVPVL